MGKILFIGDPHFDSQTPVSRIDNYRETTVVKLENLLKLAIDTQAYAVFTTGDFFNRYDIPISYINEVMTILKKFSDNGIKVFSVVGNHDLPHNSIDYFKNTPLSLLDKSGLVKCLNTYQDSQYKVEFDNTVVYGLSFTKSIDYDIDDKKQSILVMHYASENTVPNESISLDSLKQFNIVVSGHDHMYYEPIENYGVKLFRPGSFTRRTRDAYNLKREIIVYCYDTISKKMSEHVLSGVLPATTVFKNDVFIDKSVDLFSSNYNKLFRSLSLKSGHIDIFDIINDLPASVNSKSVDIVF
jgi:DNA repair exonuclease SbcCD nuclease subunit